MDVCFDSIPGLVVDEQTPVLTQKRRRLRTKWSDTAPTLHDSELSIPFAVCLQPGCVVSDVHTAVTNPDTVYTCSSLSPSEWLEKSALLRTLARNHALYPVVIRGEHSQSKRCAHAAVRRLETILDWQWSTISAVGVDAARETVERQIRHGTSRRRSRRWKVQPPSVRPVYTLPPKNLYEIYEQATWSVNDAIETGSKRTLRVYDLDGGEIWLLPACTLNALLTAPPPNLPPVPAETVPVEAPFWELAL